MTIATPVLLTSGSSQTNGSWRTSASIDPADGALVVVFQWTGSASGGPVPTLLAPTTTIPGLTLAQLDTAQADTGTRDWAGALWWGIRSGTGAGTVSVRASASQPRWGWHVFEIASGFRTSAPFRQVEKVSNGTTATQVVTLPQAPLDPSLVLAFVGSANKNNTLFSSTTGLTWLLRGPMIEASTHTMATAYSTVSPPPGSVQWESLGTAGNLAFLVEVEAAPAIPASRVHRVLLL